MESFSALPFTLKFTIVESMERREGTEGKANHLQPLLLPNPTRSLVVGKLKVKGIHVIGSELLGVNIQNVTCEKKMKVIHAIILHSQKLYDCIILHLILINFYFLSKGRGVHVPFLWTPPHCQSGNGYSTTSSPSPYPTRGVELKTLHTPLLERHVCVAYSRCITGLSKTKIFVYMLIGEFIVQPYRSTILV